MAYILIIGEAVLGRNGDRVEIDAKPVSLDHAPAYGEPTDFMNQRFPSYLAWSNFCKWAGLHEMFYNDEDGLLRPHPGVKPLNKTHQEKINEAYKSIKKKYPAIASGYSPKIDFTKGVFEDPDWPEENEYMARLEWLKFWVNWALENCEKPVFVNSWRLS